MSEHRGTGVDALQGLQEGSTIVARYTRTGTEETAQEIDRVGDQGLKTTEGVLVRVNRRRAGARVRDAPRPCRRQKR